MTSSLKETVVVGLIWKFIERIGIQLVQFIIQIVLARLLMPEDFGTVAIINVFILVATALVQYGFSTALVQKKNVDTEDYSSVMFVNFGISSVMYFVLFIVSPLLADFYSDSSLVALLRVQAIILFFGAISSIQNAVLTKSLDFRRSCVLNFIAIFAQGCTGIILALNHFGVWSLVIAQIVNSILLVIAGFIIVPWRPTLQFSMKKVKILFAFGKNILCATLLETIFTNIYSLVIGKVYQKDTLGYYNRGQSIPSMLMTTINGSIQGVLFPALSACQDDNKQIKGMMKRSIIISGYLVFPTMTGLAAVASTLIPVLLTDKWNAAIPFLQLSCLSMAFYPIHTANLQAISAIGKSDIYLKLEIIKKAILVFILLISLKFGILAVMIGSVISSALCTLVNAWPNKRLFDYSLKEQLKDLLPSISISLVMGAAVLLSGFVINCQPIFKLMIQIMLGIVVYLLESICFRIEAFNYLLKFMNNLIRKRNKS